MNKRFVGRRYPSLGGRSQGVCTKFGQAHPFGRHMVLDGVVLVPNRIAFVSTEIKKRFQHKKEPKDNIAAPLRMEGMTWLLTCW